jgi:hypothetical protein
MQASDRAFWVVLCVLVVLILVLAALLIARGRAQKTTALALGGGFALLGGRGRRRGGQPEPTYGGRLLDLDPGDIGAGADALGFPADQKAPAAVNQDQHQGLRRAVRDAITQYEADRGAPFPGAATTAGPDGVPGVGWGVTDADVVKTADRLGRMCDIMRGDFSGPPWNWQLWPFGPWLNPRMPTAGPGVGGADLNRRDAWANTVAKLNTSVGRLDVSLVDHRGPLVGDLPSKPMFNALVRQIAGLNAPNIPAPAPAPGASPAWALMLAGGYTLDGHAGADVIAVRDALVPAFNAYGANLGGGGPLRAGSLFDLAWADQSARAAIAAFDALAPTYATGAGRTLALLKENRRARVALAQALLSWAGALQWAAAIPGADAAYAALVNRLGGVVDAAPIVGSARHAVVTTLRPLGAPGQPVRTPGSEVANRRALDAAYNNATGTAIVDVSVRLGGLRTACRNCRLALELDWGTIDPLVTAAEVRFAILAALYRAAPSWARRLQSQVEKAALVQAAVDLDTAIQADPDFRAALVANVGGPTVTAQALLNLTHPPLRALPAAIDAVVLAAVAVPPSVRNVGGLPISGVPPASPNIAILLDPANWNKGIIAMDFSVRALLSAVYRRPGGLPRIHGIRRMMELYRNGGLIDPATLTYVAVDLQTETMAVACQAYANLGDRARIADIERARGALGAALTAIGVFVAGAPSLLTGAQKAEFADALNRARLVFAAIPYIGDPSLAGAPRGTAAPERPLLESQRLIHLDVPPTETVSFAHDAAEVAPAYRGDVVLEAKSTGDLEAMVGRLPAGPRLVYGLVVDQPGDMVALYKAVAIALKMRPPPEIERQVADRKRGATGWLYDIVRFESGSYYTRLREYVKPERYAVD